MSRRAYDQLIREQWKSKLTKRYAATQGGSTKNATSCCNVELTHILWPSGLIEHPLKGEMMEQHFHDLLKEKGIALSPQQLQQFHTYYEQLMEWNQKINLTAISDRGEVFLKHFYDSLTLAFFYDFTRPLAICDVGAGAGFPSLPLKICFPEIKVTIIDSLNKRVQFLESLIEMLGLGDVNVYHARAEEFGRQVFRESFDVVTARAVAKLPTLCEYCLPLIRTGGDFLAMKGSNLQPELQQSRHAVTLLGGNIDSVDSLTLPGEESTRHIIHISKQKKTPNTYPRKAGTPNKRPL